jgi:tetratricopeptide (TPR) repeat protein
MNLSRDPKALGLQLAADIRALVRQRARVETVLKDIEGVSETEGREKLLGLYQALPQVRALAATYAVPEERIKAATSESSLTEEERREFLDLAGRLSGLEKTRQHLKDLLPDFFNASILPRGPLNLVLELTRLEGAGFEASLSGDGVSTEETFELDPAVLRGAEQIRRAAETGERLPARSAEALGQRLGDWVLGPAAVKAIREAVSGGRRVRVFLPPATTALLPLPWEAMLRSSELVSLLPRVTIVRGTPTSAAVPVSLPPLPPLNVLLILSIPLDLDPRREIEVEREREMVMEPLRRLIDQGQVRLKILEVASRRRIRDVLNEGFHVVHFIGHGTEGGLLIEDEDGSGQVIPAPDLASLFTEGRPLMVWLTACRSAASPENDPHGSVAEALTRVGVPSVVAMRYSLTYEAGRTLGDALYRALAADKDPEEALESARNAVFVKDPAGERADWAIPALFSHASAEPRLEWLTDRQIAPRKDWLSGLNRLDRGFVGRKKEIRRIKDALTSKGKRVVVIQGLPGVGKSILASRVIEDLKSEFDGVFSRTVRTDPQSGRADPDFLGFLRELDYFLRRHGVTALSEAAIHEEWPVQLKLQCLQEALQARHFLIVLDSAEDLLDASFGFKDKGFEQMFVELLASGPQSRFLLTTRRGPSFPEAERFADRIEAPTLDGLEEREARELLALREEVRRLGKDDIERILERARGIPLALTSYLALASEPDRLRRVLSSPVEQVPDPASQAIAELVEQLPDDLRRAGARAALFRGPINGEALEAAAVTLSQIGALKGWSLLLHLLEADLYTMHPLVCLRLSGVLSENDGRETHGAIARYLVAFHERFSRDYEEAQKDLARSRTWVSRAHHLTPSGSTVDIALEEHYHRRAGGDEAGAGSLLQKIAEHLLTTGRLKELNRLILETPQPILAGKAWLRVWEARIWDRWGDQDRALVLLEAIRSDPSADPEARIAAAFDVASIAQGRGDLEAAEASYRQLLEAYPDHDQVKSVAYHQIGIIHERRGDYDAALEWYRKSLALAERLGDLAGIASSYHQIGIIHERRGDYDAALEWYRKSLALAERLGDLAGVASSLGQIGMLHAARKEFKEAIRATHTAALIFERIGSPEIETAKAAMGRIIGKIGEEEFKRLLSEILAESNTAQANPVPPSS